MYSYMRSRNKVCIGGDLLCHAAFVLPAAFACYKTDGDLKKLKGNTAYLSRMIDANIES